MEKRTRYALEALENIEWFAHVGEPIDNSKVVQASSWEQALRRCPAIGDNLEWENVAWEVHARCCNTLASLAKDRCDSWNDRVDELNPYIDSLLVRKLDPIVRQRGLAHELVEAVRQDIRSYLLECEFADIVPPGFYSAFAYFYAAGHFPCGWKGDFPNVTEGKLVIY